MLDYITEDPFGDSPRIIVEYWSSIPEAMGYAYGINTVNSAKWFKKISLQHDEQLNKIVATNANWYEGKVSDNMRIILKRIGSSIGPMMRAWMRKVRPSLENEGFWTDKQASYVLRTVILQTWYEATMRDAWMYNDFKHETDKEETIRDISNWSIVLMEHINRHYIRYSKERIKKILDQRAALERTMIVKEFTDEKDEDLKAAIILQKQLRFGRWGAGANLKSTDPDIYDFFVEQQHKMGIIEPPVDPLLLPPAQSAANDFGFGGLGNAIAESGYNVDQFAAGDDY
jgi:hypothetical protein